MRNAADNAALAFLSEVLRLNPVFTFKTLS